MIDSGYSDSSNLECGKISGIAKREIMELMEMVNSKVNGNDFELDREINLPIVGGQ